MSASSGATNGIGQPVRRKEDYRLLTGRGRYGDDLTLPQMVHAAFVRSSHAYARIRSVDNTAALKIPGALAVLTAADYVADGLKPIPHNPGLLESPDLVGRVRGIDPIATPHWPLPIEKARFVGEGIAMVVADSIDAAKDMVERVRIDYEPLPAVSHAVDAIEPSAPVVWDEARDNLCIDVEAGDAAATSIAFARAAHIVRLDTWVQRVTGIPLEPRTTAAAYDAASEQYTLYSGSGLGVAKARLDLAHVLGVPAEQVRVLCEEMGGNFGTLFYPEWALLAWAAHRIGRPVKWTCERSEAFLSDYQGRDLRVEAELALSADGRFLAVRSSHLT
jgi:aerobic carbon-monoxide dehydrogenase large subunit